MTMSKGEMRREALRVMRRLAMPDYVLVPLKEGGAGLFGPRNKFHKPVDKVAWDTVETLHRSDLLTRIRPATSSVPEDLVGTAACEYRLSGVGRSWWRRHAPGQAQRGGATPYQAQHQIKGKVFVNEDSAGSRACLQSCNVNLGEAPLGWLSRRKGANGEPFLTSVEVAAGERLRRDYTLAQLTARVTVDWEGFLAHVDRSGPVSDAGHLSDMAMDARTRVARAVQATGPHLSDVLIATCCHLEGLEEAEQTFGWPQRSAKIILKIALGRLATHYGLNVGGRPAAKPYVWRSDSVPSAPPGD